MSREILYFDIESHNAGTEFDMTPREFVRTFQYAFGEDEPQITTDYDEMVDLLRSARWVCGQNVSSFDLPAIFGHDSLEPLHMAMDNRVIDTFTVASLVTPAPNKFTAPNGHTFYDAEKPGTALRWLGLENLCHQFGLPGKFGNLSEIAARYNPPKTPKKNLNYGLIPLDDPEFVEYSLQDVIAVRGLWKYLREQIKIQEYDRDYIWREIELAAIMARMSNNGIKTDQEWAHNRIQGMQEVRERIMGWLVEVYDFPTEGKSPWATNQGKDIIFQVLADHGITPESRPDWEKTATGNPSLGGEVLMDLTQGTDLEEFGQAIAQLKGQRSLAQLALDSTYSDGRVHMDITSLQRSGRWSFQRPGITVWGSRGDLSVDKEVFIADKGNVLAGFDYSNADARAMASLSGDYEFARRFTEKDEDGNDLHDGHNLTGEAMFGADVYYGGGPRGADARPALREMSKRGGHGQNYNIGAHKLAMSLNRVSEKMGLGLHFWAPANPKFKQTPIERRDDSLSVPDMVDNFNHMYRKLKKFKDRAAEEGKQGYVENTWKRRMPVDPDRSWTQAPALYGQSTTREIMADALRRLVRKGGYYARSLRAVIHDELLCEFKEATIQEDIQVVKECMETIFSPPSNDAMPIEFPVGYGYGANWREAGH